MSAEHDDAIDFVANILYQGTAKELGYATSVRWWCLREEEKARFREAARKVTKQWADAERATEQEVEAEVAAATVKEGEDV